MTDQRTRAGESSAAIEAVWRLESTRLIAALVRMVRDVGLAEDLAQDALVAALAQWPESGIPRNPGAWLMTTAKRRAIDQFRSNERRDRSYAAIAREDGGEVFTPDFAAAVDHVQDDVLRLMFVCCHPSLTPEAQTTLTLKLVGGLTTREIARSYLTSEATVAQRIVRAKRTLADAGAALEEPDAGGAGRLGWSPCWASSTCCSTRAIRRPPATTGCGLRCVTRPCGWAGFSACWCRMILRCMVFRH